MAKGDERPSYQAPDVNLIPGGKDLYNFAQSLMSQGLPKDLTNRLIQREEGNIGGQMRAGEQQLREAFSSQGGAPTGALLGGITALNANANNSMTDFFTNLSQQDFAARQTGFGNLLGLNNQLMAGSNALNQFNLEGYGIDQANKFKWGQALGQLFQLGGTYLPTPKYNKT